MFFRSFLFLVCVTSCNYKNHFSDGRVTLFWLCIAHGDGGIFIGNLRKPIEQVMPISEKKLANAAGREVVLWFMEENTNGITKQVCMVQPKSEMDLQFESTKLSTPWGYVSAILLSVATFGTIALMSGFFVKPDATFEDNLADVVPLSVGFPSILGVSEIHKAPVLL